MSDDSVNVESRTSSQDKRWTIMAAILGTSTAILLFHGIEQEANPNFIREIALTVIASTIPFQGIWFLIYTFLMENDSKIDDQLRTKLALTSAFCQVMAYISICGVIMLWYNMSPMVGGMFSISAILAMILVRFAITQPNVSTDEENDH